VSRKGSFPSKLFIFEGLEPQKTRETRSSAQSPVQPHHISLRGPDSNSKYEDGNPARPTEVVNELISKNVRVRRLWKNETPYNGTNNPI